MKYQTKEHLKKQLTVQNLFLFFQIACYLTSLLLVFVNPIQFFEIILKSLFMFLSILIKIVRQVCKKQTKLILKNQVNYYIAYLLAAFQVYLFYETMAPIFDASLIALSLLDIILEVISYSFLMHPFTVNLVELSIYSVGLIFHLVMAVKSNVQSIYYFDMSGQQSELMDYVKDMMLVAIAINIAEGILVLDLLFRVYQRKQQQKIEDHKKSMEVELLDSELTK